MTNDTQLRGRPPKLAEDKRTVMFRLMLTREEKRRIETAARKAGQSMSEYIRSRLSA